MLLNTEPTPRHTALNCTLDLGSEAIGFTLVDKSKFRNNVELARHVVASEEGSVYIVDLDVVHAQYTKWFNLLPRVKPFYGLYIHSICSITIIV